MIKIPQKFYRDTLLVQNESFSKKLNPKYLLVECGIYVQRQKPYTTQNGQSEEMRPLRPPNETTVEPVNPTRK